MKNVLSIHKQAATACLQHETLLSLYLLSLLSLGLILALVAPFIPFMGGISIVTIASTVFPLLTLAEDYTACLTPEGLTAYLSDGQSCEHL